jgi:hypothetical protein
MKSSAATWKPLAKVALMADIETSVVVAVAAAVEEEVVAWVAEAEAANDCPTSQATQSYSPPLFPCSDPSDSGQSLKSTLLQLITGVLLNTPTLESNELALVLGGIFYGKGRGRPFCSLALKCTPSQKFGVSA